MPRNGIPVPGVSRGCRCAPVTVGEHTVRRPNEAADSYTHTALAAEHHIQPRPMLQTLSTDAVTEAALARLSQPYHGDSRKPRCPFP